VRYVSPLGIVLVFIDSLGLMDLDMGSQWYWWLGVLVAITLIGESLSPRIKRQLAA
jgi:NSS family neurotransmitter:Na+ symporter